MRSWGCLMDKLERENKRLRELLIEVRDDIYGYIVIWEMEKDIRKIIDKIEKELGLSEEA